MQPKFEHQIIELSTDINHWVTVLNVAGEEGWELVQIAIFGTAPPTAFMKRAAP